MKVSTLLLAPPAVAVALVVALANRSPVRFSIDPFSLETPMVAFELPLYVVIFASLLIGVLVGGASAWVGQTTWRKTARKSKREVKHLERDLARTQGETEASDKKPEEAAKPGQKQISPEAKS